MSDIEKLKQNAIELIKQYPDNISKHFLQRKLHIGGITANRLVEWLENNNIIIFKQIVVNKDIYYKINKTKISKEESL